jgi:hypothetical protein
VSGTVKVGGFLLLLNIMALVFGIENSRPWSVAQVWALLIGFCMCNSADSVCGDYNESAIVGVCYSISFVICEHS